MSSPRTGSREEERRFNLRTLAIASAASATAAVVTSQLWIAGTWIAAAITPVLVTLVSELLYQPTEKIAERLSAERPALRSEPAKPDSSPGSESPPVRIYRTSAPAPRRRKLAVGAVLGTAALALLIAVVVLTVTELAAGGAIGRSDARSTFLSPDRDRPASGDEEQQRQTPSDTTGESTPTTEPTTEPPTDSVPAPEPTTTTPPPAGEPVPTAPAPAPLPGEQP